jgi:hypothetical protein
MRENNRYNLDDLVWKRSLLSVDNANTVVGTIAVVTSVASGGIAGIVLTVVAAGGALYNHARLKHLNKKYINTTIKI